MSIGEEEEKQKYFETKGLGKDGRGERVIKMYYCRKEKDGERGSEGYEVRAHFE